MRPPIFAWCMVLAGAAAAQPPTPILWLDFAGRTDQVCADRSAARADGRLYGPTRVETPLGPGIEFDGVNDFIALPDIDFNALWGLTVEAWVRPEGAGRQPIFNFGIDTANLNTQGGKAEFIVRNVATHRPTARDSDLLSRDGFHHIVGTYDGAATRIYVDGKLRDETPHSGDIRDDRNYGARIGSGLGYPSEQWDHYFRGVLVEIKLYGAALSEEQIHAAYEATQARHPDAVALPYQAPPMLHFDFEGADPTVCVNRAPKGVIGTIQGAKRIEFAGGRALVFDGVDDYIQPRPIGLGGLTTLTVAALIRPDSHDGRRPILNYGVDTVHLNCDDGRPGFRIRAEPGDQWREALAEDTLPVGEWHHVCGVYDGSEIRLYVDGELRGATPYTGAVRSDAHYGCRIGSSLSWPKLTWDQFFHGALADIRVYDIALSAEQIRSLWAQLVLRQP